MPILGGLATLFLATSTLVLHYANRRTPIDTWWPGSFTLVLSLGATGAFLTRRLPQHPIGWLFLIGGLTQGLTGVGREYAVYAVATNPSAGWPAPDWLAWIGAWAFVGSPVTLPLILLLFPDGRFLSHRWRRVGQVAASAGVVAAISGAIMPGAFDTEDPSMVKLTNPAGLALPGLDTLLGLSLMVLAITILAAGASLIVRARRGNDEQRQQVRWVAYAGAILALEAGIEFSPLPWVMGVSQWVTPVLVVLFVVAVAVAILRYRLWDLGIIVRLSLVYAALTVLVAGIYIAAVVGGSRVVGDRVAIGPVLAAAALVAVAFAPLHDVVRRLVDRLLYGDGRNPYSVLTHVGARLTDGPSGTVLDEVVDSIASSLRFDRVAVLRPDGTVRAATGEAHTAPERFALVFRGTEVGCLEISPRPGAPLRRADRSVLGELANAVGAVVHAVASTDELRLSQRAIVVAREEERRRVRRDLHDGLGPTLAAVAMQLDGTQDLIDHDPAGAKAAMSRLGDDIRSTIGDVRRLVYDLQPPALVEVGLVRALADKASAFSGPVGDRGTLAVELLAPQDLPQLPAAVEVAAYRIVCESLNNVARHANATICRITMTAGATLDLMVDDDGIGLPDHLQHGLGTVSMAERAVELRGSCLLGRSPLGGTRVHAWLPLALPPIPPLLPDQETKP